MFGQFFPGQPLQFGAGQFSHGAIDTGNKTLIQILTGLGLTTNLWFCGDAGDINSAPSSATQWLDTSGNGNDFFRGAGSGSDASDPTFNGTPGALTSSEYWSFDGGDFFQYETTPPAAVNFHKDGAVYSFGAWIWDAGAAGTARRLLAGRGTDDGGYGWNLRVAGTDSPMILVYDDALADEIRVHADTAMTKGTWEFIGLSVNEGGGDVSFHYLNGAYNQVGGSNTFDAAYPSPGTANLIDLRIGAYNGGTQAMAAGTRLAQFFIYAGTALTKAHFDSIYNATKGRFGL